LQLRTASLSIEAIRVCDNSEEVLADFITAVQFFVDKYFEANESSCTDLWEAGRVTGWMEALIENSPQTFRSFVPEERMSFL
jgi:hypothetical protein